MQDRSLKNILVRPPLRMARNGSDVSLFIDLPTPPIIQAIAFEVAAHLSGNGAYRIALGVPKTDVVFDPAADGADFDFHDYPLGEGETFNAYFVNKAEEGKPGHWLDVGGHYYAWAWQGPTTDGLPLYLGHTFDTQLCEEEA
jgi:hypothetical protein